MKEPADTLCQICGSATFEVLTSKLTSVYDRENTYSVAKCVSCGISQTIPFPNSDELDQIYSKSYAYEMHSLVEFEKRRRSRYLVRILLENTKNRSALEFGCGEGVLLKELEKNGFAVAGVERSESASKKLSIQIPGAVIHTNTVESYLASHKNISQTVVFSHTLEHLSNPFEVLSLISASMTSECDLLVVVPNLEVGMRLWNRKYWGYWQVPVHTYHFNYTSMESLLEKAGFKVVRVWKRNRDFLSLALYISNVLNLRGSKVSVGPFFRSLIRLSSSVWSLTHPLGSDDLIVLAKRLSSKSTL